MSVSAKIPENQYGKYHIPEGLENRPASKAVLNGEAYEPQTISFMCNNAGDGDIIHAGAFFGDFIPALSKALHKDAKLWAFEPSPTNFEAAEKTVKLNNLKNVELTNAALSNRDEQVHFLTHKPDGTPLGGISKFVEQDGPGVTRVQAAMLDYTVPLDRKVSILQLDVEGHEKPALKGAYHIVHRWQPILILEYFDEERWLTRTFRGLGYKKIGKLHGNFVFATTDISL